MKPGPERVVACPSCGALERCPTLLSGNTLGAHVWSDGKVLAPMLPRNPEVARCHGCGACYWLADAPVVGTLDLWPAADATERSALLEIARGLGQPPPSGYPRREVDPTWTAAPRVREPTEAEYYDALASGFGATAEKETTVRILAWWRSNDPERGLRPHLLGSSAPAGRREENLRALLARLDESSAEGLLVEAEILRELGEFEGALKVLERAPAGHAEAVEQLRSLCEVRDRRLHELQVGQESTSD